MGYGVSGFPATYVRDDWFGAESYFAALAGTICISLPYALTQFRDASWIVLAPFVFGVFLLVVSAVRSPLADSVRRVGSGLLIAFGGFILAIPGFLAGIALGSLFS